MFHRVFFGKLSQFTLVRAFFFRLELFDVFQQKLDDILFPLVQIDVRPRRFFAKRVSFRAIGAPLFIAPRPFPAAEPRSRKYRSVPNPARNPLPKSRAKTALQIPPEIPSRNPPPPKFRPKFRPKFPPRNSPPKFPPEIPPPKFPRKPPLKPQSCPAIEPADSPTDAKARTPANRREKCRDPKYATPCRSPHPRRR